MSIFSGQASYIDDSFGSVYAHVEDETTSEVSGINGPRSGRWSVSTRNSRYSEIDDRTPTVWNGSTARSDTGQSQAHRRQSALDGNLLRKLAAVTLEEKAQAARLVQAPEPGVESVVSKHSMGAPSVVERERPKGFFVPPNIKPRRTFDKPEPKPGHQHATACPPSSVHSVTHGKPSRGAQDRPMELSRGLKKFNVTGNSDQDIIPQLPLLRKYPATFSSDVAHAHRPAPAQIASRVVSPKRELGVVRQATSAADVKECHGRLQEVEVDRTEVARAAAKALMPGELLTPDKPASIKPNTPPKHASVQSVHSSSKDSGVEFGGLWSHAPPASTHSKHSAAASCKSLHDAVKQITANSNASRSISEALAKQNASVHVGKPPSVQGSGYLDMFEQTPSQSIHSIQQSVASKKSLRDAVKQISANSDSIEASNGGWDDAIRHDTPKSTSGKHSGNDWNGNTMASRHSTKAGNDGWDDTNQRVSSKSRSEDRSGYGCGGIAPASRHSTRGGKSGKEDPIQQTTCDTRSARHSDNGWEDHMSAAKQTTKGSIGGWGNDGFGAVFEEKAASHHSSRGSRVSGNLAQAVRHVSINSDREEAHGRGQAHRSLGQNVCDNAAWAQHSGSQNGSTPASHANSSSEKNGSQKSGSTKNGDGGSKDAIGLGGVSEEPATSHCSSCASEMSKEELIDAIIQARAESRQAASNGGWNEIGQGWTQGHSSVRSTVRQCPVVESRQKEAAGGLAGKDGWGASVHNSASSKRSSKPSRISVAAPEEGPTIFAGGGWISPHPLSEASMPQERIALPAEYAKAVAGGIEKNEMTYEDWKAVQRSGSAAESLRSRPASDRSSRHSDHSSCQRAAQGSSISQSGSQHSGLTEAAAARYQAELAAIVQQGPPASVVKNSKAGVDLKMPWD
ncbi:hypothetical protein Tdes44962_MAKER06169 [Teratosphaeria destructans]|uniref:Uncharacterized protein n=1 Tax=Teratosphaeria destructans TaxID=418781 RepID=A0A9W7VY43_9PEZI|nr:hypothetical protein Tdes44962_MAKER06169 [Teratosphaeria destructans]